MNKLEHQMLDVAKQLKECFGAVSIRAEFESEGTKLEELLRLKEMADRAGLGITLKIGGCESVRDLLESRTVGVDFISAPIIESPYALHKYLLAVKKVFPTDELADVEVLVNIETATGINNIDRMLESAELAILKGVVIERVDLCFSKGLSSDSINDPEINELVEGALKKINKKGLKTTIGGGVSADSLPFFRRLKEGVLTRYETRKVVFDAEAALQKSPEKGILTAMVFEILYLKNKMSFFKEIASADTKRINQLEQRYFQLITQSLSDRSHA